MTWFMNDSTGDTYNLLHTSGAQSMYRLMRVFEKTGWTVVISSDGQAGGHTHGNVFTKDTSGSGGMDNNSAYFVVQDPSGAGGREYCFQRSTNHYTWSIVYSRSAGFTGGDDTTRPTATDEKGVADGSTSATAIFFSSGSWNCQIAAQNAAVNGVYAFWLACTAAASTAVGTLVACDAISTDSQGTGDTDPSVHIAGNAVTISTLCTNSSTNDCMYGWARYAAGAGTWEWDTFTLLYLTDSNYDFIPSSSIATNPEDSSYLKVAPVAARIRAASTRKGVKGALAQFRWNHNPTAVPYGNVLDDGTLIYMTTPYFALPGWPNAAINPAV